MRNIKMKEIKKRNRIKILLLCIISVTILASCSKTVNVSFHTEPNQIKTKGITGLPSHIKITKNVLKDVLKDEKATLTKNKILEVTASKNKDTYKFTLLKKDIIITVSSKIKKKVTPTPKPLKKKVTKKPTATPKPTPKPRPTSIPAQVSNLSLNETAQKILDTIITKDMNDIEKVKAVHDYIVLHTEYDTESLKKEVLPESIFEAEGVLNDGKAVCQGYAYAFQLFMKLLHIDSKIVTGKDLTSGVGHAWNMVNLDGEWYQVDTTWDDPVPDKKGKVQYHYFLMTDQIFSSDHSWNKDKFPACTSEKYLYYIYQDDIISSITLYEKAFMKKYNAGVREITILYPEKAIPDMNFLLNYDNTRKEKEGGYTVAYQSVNPWRLGDYTVFTVIME